MANPPVLIKTIPPQIVNEGASFGPLDLNDFIHSLDGVTRFQAGLANGDPLPRGLICEGNGMMQGIPAEGTQGNYEVIITAQNESAEPFIAEFKLTIKSRIAIEAAQIFGEVKSRIWEALGKDLPIPEISDIVDRPITAAEIYYLLQRYATMFIWDAYNLDPPGEKKLIQVEGSSEHFNIYDCGSCLVCSPKDLYSYERNLEDALQSARAMAGEAFKRGWAIEFSGFDKMVRAAWIELQLLGERYEKKLEIVNYQPSPDDLKIVDARKSAPGFGYR